MRKPHLLLRVATVVSSILLVAAFISYRAGVFDGLLGTSATGATIMQETPADSVGQDPAFMGGTKSMVFVEPPAANTAGGQVAPASQAPRPPR
jgi:hypothetical protein